MSDGVENNLRITKILSRWYQANHRNLPWRETDDPYAIWLSEIILQQTRVEQGTPYYLRFIGTYPSVQYLAAADEDDILKLWQGLGYYSRARNLHKTAKHITANLNGKFPSTYAELLKLKGIGNYTASAIASIAFNEPVAAIDGNVVRLVSRLYGISEDVTKANTRQQIEAASTQLLDLKNPGNHNQAMMEFGATQCKPQNPMCSSCPLIHECVSFKMKTVGSIPFKSKKLRRTSRYFHYLVAQDTDSNYLIQQRQSKDIWKGLYQFPLIETNADSELNRDDLESFFESDSIGIQKINLAKKHILSHQDIHARFYHIQLGEPHGLNYDHVMENDIHQYALPRLIDRYVEEHDLRTGNATVND